MTAILRAIKTILTEVCVSHNNAGEYIWSEIEKASIVVFDEGNTVAFCDYASAVAERTELLDQTACLCFVYENGSGAAYVLLRVPQSPLTDQLVRYLQYCPRFLLLKFMAPDGEHAGLHPLALAVGDVQTTLDLQDVKIKPYPLDGKSIPYETYNAIMAQTETFGFWRFPTYYGMRKLGLVRESWNAGPPAHFTGQVGPTTISMRMQ